MTNYSDLSYTELNRRAAELQGWTIGQAECGPAWFDAEGMRQHYVEDYHPSQNSNQAYRLLDATIMATDQESRVERFEGGWTAWVQVSRWPPGVREEIVARAEATRPTADEAVARAITEAWCAARLEETNKQRRHS